MLKCGTTLLQVISASAAGFLLCALFIRSGSLLPSMLMHAINDVYAFMNLDLVSEAGVMEGTLKTSDIVLNMILSVLQIIIAIYLLHPSAGDEIMETWNRKWGKEN
ncbi:CPBP family intramembrane glutamic endopeptidase [Butyrivibrio sp. YAB3001]|uniref:CPBP family intramembrane glutamic endopeptidase n=1 Tax=Butyrivibrio sp. YAB3001 TaxID=1520812 RepID=UPI0008F671E1|nr:CPBP family intramembrane glutamic endopeptidase [Butyrivibrio sp. YAB3001]SFC33693.1 CAAX protease self-immunity [Butyrivibrio sp. YAB3001]